MSVMVVDDSVVHRTHAVGLCRGLGIRVVYEAHGGAEALAMVAELRPAPQVMIIDIEMPDMNGVELLDALRMHNVPVSVIVASGRESAMIDSVQMIAAGLGFHVLAGLEKPLTAAALGKALARAPGAIAANPPAAMARPAVTADMLQAALAASQLAVHYQPKVDVRSGQLLGVEALARWTDPHLGAVAPMHFVALAEECGLIQALTFSVLSQALRQVAEWREQGLQLSIAVNLSPRLLDWAGIAHEIIALVRDHDVPFDQVTFEVTESSVVASQGAARELLARLRLRGFGLAIDDYGTGFSSMQQLSRIPFTELKIDRSFVRGATDRRSMRVILKAAIDMARQLNLVSTGEGIETLGEWRLLQSLGCDVGQGYLISPPMPAARIPGWAIDYLARSAALRAHASEEHLTHV